MHQPIATESDYYRDAIAWAMLERLPRLNVEIANLLGKTGEQFNAAIQASVRLQEITKAHE